MSWLTDRSPFLTMHEREMQRAWPKLKQIGLRPKLRVHWQGQGTSQTITLYSPHSFAFSVFINDGQTVFYSLWMDGERVLRGSFLSHRRCWVSWDRESSESRSAVGWSVQDRRIPGKDLRSFISLKNINESTCSKLLFLPSSMLQPVCYRGILGLPPVTTMHALLSQFVGQAYANAKYCYS
jgi:hypothetical protein